MTEFDDVIRRLEDERPTATARELDEIKQRVRRRAAEPSRRNQSMKSRIAILGMLVTGMLFSTAGAGLAIQGVSSTNNAAVSQYATPTPTPTPSYDCPSGTTASASQKQGTGDSAQECGEGGILPAEAENAPEAESGVAPASDSGGGVSPQQEEEPSTQPERQQAAAVEGSQLPFTGFAAIPVLLGGLALLTGGLILRRRTRSE